MKIGKTVSDSQGDDLYLYFDSISELLKHTETMKGYRFINALTGRLRNADAVGYFRMPTEEHEAEVVDTFGSLFSHSVGTDGEIMVID